MTTTEAPQFREILPDGRLRLHFSEPQYEAWNSKAPITIMQAGTGSGKTSLGVHWLEREMSDRGPGDYLAVTSNYPLLDNKVLPEMETVFGYLLRWGQYKAGKKIWESYEKDHGAPAYRIIVRSAENADSIEAATCKGAWLDEMAQRAFGRDAWEAVQRRLGFYQGRVLGTTTLYEVSSWYKTDIYNRFTGGDPRIKIIQADSISNPAYPREEYEEKRKTMPRWKFDMFYRGRFTQASGLIYDAFSESTQVVDRFPIPDNWLRYVGHDFGIVNTAAIWFAQHPDTGHLYAYRSYHQGGKSVGQHVQEFQRLSQGEHIMVRAGGSHQEEEIRYAYTAAGWPISEPNIRSVEAGIDRVYSFIAQNQLFVFRDLSEYLDELLSYSRELDDNYQPTDQIQDQSSYHQLDATRYVLSTFAPERVIQKREVYMKVTSSANAGRSAGAQRILELRRRQRLPTGTNVPDRGPTYDGMA